MDGVRQNKYTAQLGLQSYTHFPGRDTPTEHNGIFIVGINTVI